MQKKHDKPWWYGNFPIFEGKKKKPVKISKDMEVVTSYGRDGNDIQANIFINTDKVMTSDYNMPPGAYLIPSGIHSNEEFYFIVKGEAVVLNPHNGEAVKAKSGETIIIPRGTLHAVHNFGEDDLYVISIAHILWDDEKWEKAQINSLDE